MRGVHSVLERRRAKDAELRRQVIHQAFDDQRIAAEWEMGAMLLARTHGNQQPRVAGQRFGDFCGAQFLEP
jgi:hypothetical protein